MGSSIIKTAFLKPFEGLSLKRAPLRTEDMHAKFVKVVDKSREEIYPTCLRVEKGRTEKISVPATTQVVWGRFSAERSAVVSHWQGAAAHWPCVSTFPCAVEVQNLTQSIRPKSEIFGTGLGCQHCNYVEDEFFGLRAFLGL